MAKDLSLAPGIGSDGDFINGNLVDSQTEIVEFINQDIVQFFQRLMEIGVITPNGNFDNDANDYQFIEALMKTNKLIQYLSRYIFNPTGAVLDGTNTLTLADGAGSAFNVTGDVTNHTIDFIYITPGFAAGERLLIYIETGQDITISHGSNILTPKGVDMIAEAGSFVEFTANEAFKWEITSSSKPLIKASGEIYTEEQEIGDWDMQSTSNVQVNLADFGLENSKVGAQRIRSISVIIREDDAAGGETFDLTNTFYDGSVPDYKINGSVEISSVTTWGILLRRVSGAAFDKTNFNDTSYNRGWVTITYFK